MRQLVEVFESIDAARSIDLRLLFFLRRSSSLTSLSRTSHGGLQGALQFLFQVVLSSLGISDRREVLHIVDHVLHRLGKEYQVFTPGFGQSGLEIDIRLL